MQNNIIDLINFDNNKNQMGSLVSLESQKNLPFQLKRIYYLHGLDPTGHRGKHAHYKLQQIAVCISGSCTFLLDDGIIAEEVALNNPNQGLCLHPMIWHEMYDFSRDCCILVLASDYYDEADYIRDYDVFLQYVRPNYNKAISK